MLSTHLVSRSLLCSAIAAYVALPACAGDDSDTTAGPGAGGPSLDAGQSGVDAAADAIVWTDTGGQADGTGACVAESQQGSLEKMPVDIIMYVDTSGTMAPASASVEANINANLAQVLEAANVDFRLIVLSGYGADSLLCVDPPLGGAPCEPDPPPVPANTSRFFHYPAGDCGSGALFDNILNWYTEPDTLGTAPNGWSAWVREGALKAFLIISDTSSGPKMSADDFDAELLALDPDQFGTSSDRDYILHAIIGLRENDPPTNPWTASDPIVMDTCTGGGYSGAVGPGEEGQKVAILTGGLRFPMCEFASFDVVFQALAEDVVAVVPVSCELPFPMPPQGETLDPDTIQLDYHPGDGSGTLTFSQVASVTACAPESFYVEDETIFLCPEACSAVQADSGASIDVRFGCDVGFAK